MGGMARRVEIQKMGTEEGALLLLRRVKYIADCASLEAADEDDRARAKEITLQLDGLPLALDQAAAYIEETGCGLLGYLDLSWFSVKWKIGAVSLATRSNSIG